MLDFYPKLVVLGIVAFVIVGVILIGPTTQLINAAKDMAVPDWIKNNAKWWSEGLIAESDFMSAMEYLINEGIIQVQPKIVQVVAANSAASSSDRAQSFTVTMGLVSKPNEAQTYYTFTSFVHSPQTMHNVRFIKYTGDTFIPENYFDTALFYLESIPSKDKQDFYELLQKQLKKGGLVDASTQKLFVNVDIIAGDGRIIQTWEYRNCDLGGYWVFTEDFKEVYRFGDKDEIEIHDRTQFDCAGFHVQLP